MSPVETQDSFITFSLEELSKDDCAYEILNKLVSHLRATLSNPGASAGISILRDAFIDAFVGSYAIKENGAGITIGMFKMVDGDLISYRPALPNEVAFVKGSGIGPLVIPEGWRLVTDEEIQAKNIGVSPNWKLAAIEYVGI